jgi:hypothetical protein
MDGNAINTKMIAGAIVQIVSIICPSRMNHLVCVDGAAYVLPQALVLFRSVVRQRIQFRRWGITQNKEYNLMKLAFSSQIFETYSNINFMKIHPVEAELFHVDRQMHRWTDTTKLRVAFRSFANTPKNSQLFPSWNCLYLQVEYGQGEPTACPEFLT